MKEGKNKMIQYAKELSWEKVADSMQRQIMGYDDNIMMVKVKFKKGGIGESHSHHHSQTSYVVNGKFELTIGEEEKTISTGDAFYVPPHMTHGCICLEDGMLIDVFSPKREEFLE